MYTNMNTVHSIMYNEYPRIHIKLCCKVTKHIASYINPRQGDVFIMMKLSRSKFKYALRKCKRDKETIIADNIAEQLCQKDDRDFWKNIKQMTNKKVKLPTNIDGVHGDNDIVSMWKQHYAAIFNSVENSSCDQAHSDFCNTNIAFDNAMTVDLFEMKAVIDDLASRVIPGKS